MAALEQAPALRVAAAEIARAQADERLGAALASPDIAASVKTRREQADHILTGGVSITLPLFDKGQGIRAEAEARLRRLTMERDAVRRTLLMALDSGLSLFQQRKDVAETLRTSALPAADDNESLAMASLDAGEMSLMNFLLVRQDVTATRLAYVDALAAAAAASIEVDAAAGVLR
jgi:cobalt-zinc-cadmium efflux system outer membrane protein